MDIIRPALHHVTLKTTRLDEMIAWYGVVIGARVNFRDAMNAWMTNDAANHRIALLSAPGLGDDERKSFHNGMHHSAFEYESFADLMLSYDRMSRAGIEPAFCLEHGLTISLYYRDPEGNFVELQSDNFGDWDKSSEWMRTSPVFRENPIGVFFDPRRVFEAHAAGADFAALQAAIRAGDYAPSAGMPDIGLPMPSPAPAS
ncbi:extradiol dioxygenase [Roseomonas nepalensis]|uniref:Extradiol dioxygenase n=1 Tax=Muricoccus nepalensis TaxID=1854500 RepID=A0A502EPD2_9PROT|nr:VOC family protein [Roseomonas nepalensis]TPG38360.1 extradiol dioxygenase [Roseomonas nepalensis]